MHFPDSISHWLKGKFSRRFAISVQLPMMIGLYVILMIIAVSFFPGGYNITKHYISNGGNLYRNPDGWIIWMVAHVLYGIFMIPLVGYAEKNLIGMNPIPSERNLPMYKRGKKLLFISTIGWILMGSIPQYRGEVWSFLHAMNAILLLGGSFFGLFHWDAFLLRSPQISKKAARLITTLSFSGFILILFGIIVGFITGITIDDYLTGEVPWFLKIMFWEWLLLITIMLTFSMLIICIPFTQNLQKKQDE